MSYVIFVVVICQAFDSTSTDAGTGQDGEKEDGDETEEKDDQPREDRYYTKRILHGGAKI